MSIFIKKEYTATYTRTFSIDVFQGGVQISENDTRYSNRDHFIRIAIEDWDDFVKLIQQATPRVKDQLQKWTEYNNRTGASE